MRDRETGRGALLFGIVPAFEPKQAIAAGCNVQRAIAGRPDVWHRATAIAIHDDAVGDVATCRTRQLQFRLKPNADQHKINFDDLVSGLDAKPAAARHDGSYVGIEPYIDMMLLRQIPEHSAEGFRQKPRHDLGFAFEQGYREPARPGRGGEFKAYETTADDSDMRALAECLLDRRRILDRPQMKHIGKIVAGNPKTAGAATGRKQERLVSQRGSVIKPDRLRCRVDGHRATAKMKPNPVALGIGFGQPVLGKGVLARQHVLGQRRTLIGKMQFVADQVDRAVEAGFSHRDDGGGRSLACTDDDHVSELRRRRQGLRPMPLRDPISRQIGIDENVVALDFGRKRLNVFCQRRAQRLAGADIEHTLV